MTFYPFTRFITGCLHASNGVSLFCLAYRRIPERTGWLLKKGLHRDGSHQFCGTGEHHGFADGLLFPWDAAGVVYIASIRSLSPFRRPGKLNVGVDTIQHGVEGLTYLLTESSKLMISETDFQDSIHVLGFSDELNKLLLQLYLDNRKEIRSILSELAPKLPSYHSLEWRLDVQLASRSLRQQIKPAVTIKLHLHQNEDQTAQVLQTDPSTLLHLIQQLEQALGEMKTNHCRRIVRNMK
ncbi:COMM domain-containing protein 2 isoform X6 [Balearica regulorum gibbericeps]|uniref:COMM domain-containing protein 2 isoform X6 n=1 Tax=Balearica regulorum gibbericeps TaxID=100784 RepID=UPI003F62852A